MKLLQIPSIKVMTILIVLTSIMFSCSEKQKQPVEKDKKMEWWREARFGMFIHFGLYSISAGEYNGNTNYGEWLRTQAQIPVNEYDKYLTQFNPVKFNAEEWVKAAKDAGMKYIVITSKHHDGFCLFDSKETDFDVMATPFKRDIMKEMAEACRKHDMKICWYHSIMDWHHPDYLPRREWEKNRSKDGADYRRYVDHLKKQLKELVKNYGDIGVLWFDGEWENTWTHEYGVEVYNYLLNLQPNLIINIRIDVSRNGLGGMSTNKDAIGDYGTPEQEVPETGLLGVDWETCMTMNNHWGFNKFDNNWKTPKELLQNLADIASKGGNYLLNVGPTSEGLFPQQSLERLKIIGNWMKINGEAIYGTKASPIRNLSWGRCTQKETTSGTTLYLHVFDWPTDQVLNVWNIINTPSKAYMLSDLKKTPLKIIKEGIITKISVPLIAPDSINSVIVLEYNGKLDVLESPEFDMIAANSDIQINFNKNLQNTDIKVFYTVDGTFPSEKSNQMTGKVTIAPPAIFKAVSYYKGQKFGEPFEMNLPVSLCKSVQLKTKPSEKYKTTNPNPLTDGQFGSNKFSDGNWYGFEGEDFQGTVDLGKIYPVNQISLSYLVETHSWIFAPIGITFEISEDGKTFKKVGNITNDPTKWNTGKGSKIFSINTNHLKARYIKVYAKNITVCPDDHPGKGGKAWIFIDEIIVE